MKTHLRILAFSLLTLAILPGCTTVTDPVTGKTSKVLSAAAKTELQSAGNVLAQAVANAALIGAQSVTNQYLTTGKIDTKQLASAEIYGLASNAQGYVGQLVPRATLVDAVSTPQVASQIAATLPAQVQITQATVDALQAQAASLSPNASR